MSNIANYSPYNKSFKFICFQNKAYHEAAKSAMKPVVRTNIRKRLLINPQPRYSSNASFLKQSQQGQSSPTSPILNRSASNNMSMSVLSVKSAVEHQPMVVHKNASFEKFEKWRINRENQEMVKRLLNTNCQVITRKKSGESFQKHLKYKNIRRIYDSKNIRKQPLAIPQVGMLCPTLASFHLRTSSVQMGDSSNVFSNYSQLLCSRPQTTRTSNSKRRKQKQQQ